MSDPSDILRNRMVTQAPGIKLYEYDLTLTCQLLPRL